MRRLAPLAVILATTLPAAAEGHWPMPGDIIVAAPTGLLHAAADGAPRDAIPFGTGFQNTMHVMVAIFGHEVQVGFPQECGAGPMVSAQIPGQIDLMFQDDRFAGWMLIGDAALRTATGLGVGSPRADLAAEAAVAFVETGLGTEFDAGEIFGLMSEDGASVQAAWTGTTCIFR